MGCPGVVAYLDPSPVGMDRRMGRCKTKRIGMSPRPVPHVWETYARWLIHIDPGAINIQASVRVVEELELVCPIVLCVWIEPI